jgi:hypothetical protein
MKKIMLIVTVTSLFLLVSVMTTSAQYIENWTYDIQYGFKSFTDGDASNPFRPNPVTGSVFNTNYENYPTVLTWGQPSDGNSSHQSSLTMAPASLDGTIVLNEAPISGPNIIHNNFTILAGTGSLTSAVLSSRLWLYPQGAPANPDDQLYRDFDIYFFETPNEYEDSLDDDIFMVENFENFEQEFDLGDYTYKAIFEVDTFDELNDFQKAYLDLGPEDKAYGFTTPEGLSTTKATWFSIELVSGPNNPVPEPSTLILFGLGLVGLAGIARKKIKQ